MRDGKFVRSLVLFWVSLALMDLVSTYFALQVENTREANLLGALLLEQGEAVFYSLKAAVALALGGCWWYVAGKLTACQAKWVAGVMLLLCILYVGIVANNLWLVWSSLDLRMILPMSVPV